MFSNAKKKKDKLALDLLFGCSFIKCAMHWRRKYQISGEDEKKTKREVIANYELKEEKHTYEARKTIEKMAECYKSKTFEMK